MTESFLKGGYDAMLRIFRPHLRSGKLFTQRVLARLQNSFPSPESNLLPVRFIIGCGRSGTTILGDALSLNPHAKYLHEPYHLWQLIDHRTDVTGLHSDPQRARFFLNKEDVTVDAAERYKRLLSRAGDARKHECVIEKTPHNIGRIGWLGALEPDAHYVHIVRNGLSVVRSIDRLASKPFYTLSAKPNYNQWWGEREAKWKALAREGAGRGYFPDIADHLDLHIDRGAYQWLVSLGEARAWRNRIGDRMLEITYTEFTLDPAKVCSRIADHFGFPAPTTWLRQVTEIVSPERVYEGPPPALPEQMAERFNTFQQEYGFLGRAVVRDHAPFVRNSF